LFEVTSYAVALVSRLLAMFGEGAIAEEDEDVA
jgi:hypothetical protein